jgi:hypothetical protein
MDDDGFGDQFSGLRLEETDTHEDVRHGWRSSCKDQEQIVGLEFKARFRQAPNNEKQQRALGLTLESTNATEFQSVYLSRL